MRILCIEPSENHHETLLAWIAGAARINPRPQLYVVTQPAFQTLYAQLEEVEGWFPLPSEACDVRQLAKRISATHVFHNTAYGRYTHQLISCLRSLPHVGIVHNTAKLRRLSWMGWRIARRLEHFWVLRHGLWAALPRWWRRKSTPLLLTQLPPSLEAQIPPLSVPDGQRWFAIPGRVECKRRAYSELIEVLQRNPPPSGWRFLLLGPANARYSDWPSLHALLEESELGHHFVTFPEGLDFPSYHAYLRASEAILPLIHPTTPYWQAYLRSQITGAFSLAFTHRKPMLLHKAFATEADLADASLFYETTDELLSLLREGPISRAALYQSERWNPDQLTRAIEVGLLRSENVP